MTSISRPGRARSGFHSIRVRLPFLLFAGSLLAATGASAEAPALVKDLYPGFSPTSSASAYFDSVLGTSGSRAFLSGSDDGGNAGIWVTNGTVAGTRLLLDYPGRSGVDVDGTFFFGASTQDGGSLWKSDGTTAGTSFVSRFSTDPTVLARVLKPTKVGSRLFFVVDDGVHGAEIWTSDGTTAGTRLVKDVMPGPTGSLDYTASLVDAGGILLFSCSSTSGCGLQRSDGTEAGTVPLADLAAVTSLVNVNGTIFFTASDPAHGAELWKSDGTVAGTVLVRDILPGTGGSLPASLVPFGGALYFRLGSDGSTWKSDGTEAGTVLAHSFPSSAPLVPSGALLFTASGSELWASDGSAAGTRLVRDFGVPFLLTWTATVPGALLFWVDRGVDGLELWQSDGTTAGTTRVEILAPGDANPFPLGSVSIPGATVHLVANMSFGLWRSDGTSAGTFPLQAPLFDPNDGIPMWLADANGTLFFSAVDADHGNEPWRSDGTPGGTVLVKDINPGQDASSPGPFFASPSTVFFTAWTPGTGRELYRTDGTGAGTTLVKDVQTVDAWPQELGLFGELFLYAPDDGVHGREPWRSDGTPDGTFLLGRPYARPGLERRQSARRAERRVLLRRVQRRFDDSLEDGRDDRGHHRRRADARVRRERCRARRRARLRRIRRDARDRALEDGRHRGRHLAPPRHQPFRQLVARHRRAPWRPPPSPGRRRLARNRALGHRRNGRGDRAPERRESRPRTVGLVPLGGARIHDPLLGSRRHSRQ